MKINTIRPFYYFLDNIKVNFKLPFDHLNHYERSIIKDFYWSFYKDLEYQLYQIFTCEYHNKKHAHSLYNEISEGKFLINEPEFTHVHLHKKDPHYNYKLEWGGKWFSRIGTKRILDDVKAWYKDYLHIYDFITEHFYIHLNSVIGKDLRSHPQYKIHCTVSRIDIAFNKKGNMLHCEPVANKNHKEIHYYQDRKFKQHLSENVKKMAYIPTSYIYGLSIGKRSSKSGIHFRCYDKRFDLKGIQSSIDRFGTIYYVRKEWELKSRVLRRFNLVTPEDVLDCFKNKSKLTEIIYRIRKSADNILRTDNMLYKSIHSDLNREFINPLNDYSVNEHQFNEMLKRDINIFSKKVNSDLVQIHPYNPLKHLNGIIDKKGLHLDAEGIQKLIEKLLGKYHYNDLDHEDYEQFVKDTLKGIKESPEIKTALEDIKKKKEFISLYTKDLIKQYKKSSKHLNGSNI